MVKELKEAMDKRINKTGNKMYEEITEYKHGNRNYKRNQIEILDMKSTIIKNEQATRGFQTTNVRRQNQE